jgi:hypothetical protein
MAKIAAQVRLMRFNELPEDVVINTFAFGTSGPGDATPTDLSAITTSLIDFYNGTSGAGPSLASFMTNFLTNTAKHEVRLYDIDDPMGSPPRRTTTFSLSVSSSQQLPGEVSLCLSFKAAPIPGVSPARLRGRVYWGPLSVGVLGLPANSDMRPAAGVQNALADAGLRLASAAGHELAVYSRLQGGVFPVTDLWVDNAFDTQRRRGAKPTSRVTRTLNV